MAKILLVEDLSASRELYATMLKNLGYEVTEAANGDEGLENGELGLETETNWMKAAQRIFRVSEEETNWAYSVLGLSSALNGSENNWL